MRKLNRSHSCVARSHFSKTQGHFEQLEERTLLSISPLNYDQVSAAWFGVVSANDAASTDAALNSPFDRASDRATIIGPTLPNSISSSQWIVRLTQEALSNIDSPAETTAVLQEAGIPFRVIRGLGLPGQVLIEAPGVADADIETALRGNSKLAYFERNSFFYGQDAKYPNDADFSKQWGLDNPLTPPPNDHDIDAPEAWFHTTGSRQVVVGVLDSGIDYTHPDLYQNVWINQAEIPLSRRVNLTDVDQDGLITFWDLNDPVNQGTFKIGDVNGNSRIDAGDILALMVKNADGSDSGTGGWVDGVSQHGDNQHIDDLIGWNFVNDTNDPFDDNGHGTQVSGIIGASGNNDGVGVAGVVWQTSLMPLKFLNANRTGSLSAAAEAVNYAAYMRGNGANIRVLNASFVSEDTSSSLADAIQTAADVDTGILVVAAAGNAANPMVGGINIDVQPFYPACYGNDNLIAVAASYDDDQLSFLSNYGYQSVDLVAPGDSIYTTELNGGYGFHSGTSMAVAFVTGTAALVWSKIYYATASEVRRAILESTDSKPELQSLVARGGRLNAYGALLVDTIAPRADLVSAPDITVFNVENTTEQVITVCYTDNETVMLASLGNSDLVVRRADGSGTDLAVHLASPTSGSNCPTITATYHLPPPSGRWNAASSGDYDIFLLPYQVRDYPAYNNARTIKLGTFRVTVTEEGVFQVNKFEDAADANVGDGQAKDSSNQTTLRAAIQEANELGGQTTILLDPGTFSLSIPGIGEENCLRGDLDIRKNIVIMGSSARQTFIDARYLERIFDIQASGRLTLSNVTLIGGLVGETYSGGAIRNRGYLKMTNCTLAGNTAGWSGGALLNQGEANIEGCTFSDNLADSVAVPAAILSETEFRVNTNNVNITQNAASAAMNTAGQSVVAWRNMVSSNYYPISVQRYDALGAPVGGEISCSGTNSWSTNPVSVALDADGNFAVAWAGFGDAGGNGIVVQRFYANGTTNGDPIWVNDHEAGDQIDPLIVMDPEGNFVVAWIDITGYDGSGYGIYYQCFNAQGVCVGVNRLANTYTTGDQTNPALAMDAQGNFLIAWEGAGQEDANGVYFQLFDKSGNPQIRDPLNQEEVRAPLANVPTTLLQSDPSVAFDPSGNFLVAWSSYTGSIYNCFAKHYDSLGNSQGTEFVLKCSLWTQPK